MTDPTEARARLTDLWRRVEGGQGFGGSQSLFLLEQADADALRAILSEPRVGVGMPGREEIARIVDPDAINAGFAPERGAVQNDIDRRAEAARAKADAILALLPAQPQTEAGEYVMVPREPTAGWAQMMAEMRQGRSSTPRCEPPGAYAVGICKELIAEVLAAAPPPPSPVPAQVREAEKLADHWLCEMTCNHEMRSDRASCACGWVSAWLPSIGDAAKSWATHALAALDGGGRG